MERWWPQWNSDWLIDQQNLGWREHALGQRRPFHLAVCWGEQKVGFDTKRHDLYRSPGMRYTRATASTWRATDPFLPSCLRSTNNSKHWWTNISQDCLFVVEIHGENIALMDHTGRYLSPGSGSQAVLKTKWVFSNIQFLLIPPPPLVNLSLPQVWQSGHWVCSISSPTLTCTSFLIWPCFAKPVAKANLDQVRHRDQVGTVCASGFATPSKLPGSQQ